MNSKSSIAQEFRDALHRIVARAPKNAELVEMLKKGRLKVSISTVAIEAGHSRSLIGYDGCALPDVRSEVQEAIFAQPTRGAGESIQSENRRLRLENAEMRDALDAVIVAEADATVQRWNVMRGRAADGGATRNKSAAQRKASLRLVPNDTAK